MYIASVAIEGTVPLIQGRTLDHPDGSCDWKEKLYLNEGELLYQPAADIVRCMMAVSGDELKEGFSIEGPHLLFEGLLVPDELTCDPEKTLYLKGTTPIIGAGWRLNFLLRVSDSEKFSPFVIRHLINEVGLSVGIGIDTPKYGRFKVVDLQVDRS